MRDRHGLEQAAHAARRVIGEASEGAVDRGGLGFGGARPQRSRRAPRCRARAGNRLAGRAVHRRPAAPRRPRRDARNRHAPSGRPRPARRADRRRHGRFTACRVSPTAEPHMAVIDDERGAALGREARRQPGHDVERGFRPFQHGAGRGRCRAAGGPARPRGRRRAFRPRPGRRDARTSRVPCGHIAGSARRRRIRWRGRSRGRPARRRHARARRPARPRRTGLSPAAPSARGSSRRDGCRRRRRKRGTTRAARKTSAISVPRPGPSSTRRTGSGAPIRRQTSPPRARSARRTSG